MARALGKTKGDEGQILQGIIQKKYVYPFSYKAMEILNSSDQSVGHGTGQQGESIHLLCV